MRLVELPRSMHKQTRRAVACPHSKLPSTRLRYRSLALNGTFAHRPRRARHTQFGASRLPRTSYALLRNIQAHCDTPTAANHPRPRRPTDRLCNGQCTSNSVVHSLPACLCHSPQRMHAGLQHQACAGFGYGDALAVFLGTVINIWLTSIIQEPFMWCTTVGFLVCVVSDTLRGVLLRLVAGLPVSSVLHTLFWVLQLLYAYSCGTAQHAILAHARVHTRMEFIASAWVILGFVGGLFPGRAGHKGVLFVVASVAIVARKWLLVQAWQRARAEQGPLHSATRGAATAWTAGDELMAGGVKCLIVAPLISLVLGTLARSRLDSIFASADAQLSTNARRHAAEVAELQSRAAELETARREALLREVERARRDSGRAGSAARRATAALRGASATGSSRGSLCSATVREEEQSSSVSISSLRTFSVSDAAADDGSVRDEGERAE